MSGFLDRAWMTVSGTPGTGNVTLGAAFSNAYNTFAQGGAVNGGKYRVVFEEGNDFEISEVTYNSTGPALDSRTVVRSKIGGTAGTSLMNLTSAATVFALGNRDDFREMLTASRTYYVRTDGNDTNSGLVNSSGGAFLTIQRAINVALGLDFNGFTVTIKLGNTGTYTGQITVNRRNIGGGALIIDGDVAVASSYLINVTGSAFVLSGSCDIRVQGVKVQATGSGFSMSGAATLTMTGAFEMGACAGAAFNVTDRAKAIINANYTISGGGAYHYLIEQLAGIECTGRTVTVTGTPAYSQAFIFLQNIGFGYYSGSTFSGAATGQRYSVNQNSVLNTGGGGASFFPGNAGGATATGGQYV